LSFSFPSAIRKGNERYLLPFGNHAGTSRRNEIIAGARWCLVATTVRLQQIAGSRLAPLDQRRKPRAVHATLLEGSRHAGRDQAIHLLLDRLVLAPPVLKSRVTHTQILRRSPLQLKISNAGVSW
jgi:hypothetical protein